MPEARRARPGGGARTFEEMESRRSKTIAGEAPSSRLASVLILVFLAFGALALYFFLGQFVGLGENYALTEVCAVTSVASLAGYRLRTRRPGRGRKTSSLLVDGAAVVGVAALTAWTFVFPMFYSVPQGTAIIGVYSLILIVAMIGVFRFTQPGRGTGRDGYFDVETSLRELGRTVEQLARRQENRLDPAVADRLSSIAAEVAAMRKEVSTIREGGQRGSVGSGTVVFSSGVQGGVQGAGPKPERTPVQVLSRAPDQEIQKVAPSATFSPETGVSVPESAVDNPWLDVLKRRKSGASGSG